MKKVKLYMLALLAVGLAACSEDFNDYVAPPQSHPQEDPQVVEGFAIAKDTDFGSAIVLADKEEDAVLQAVKATATPDMAEGASVTFRLQLSATEDFAKTLDLASTSTANAATVSAGNLDAAIIELFGRAPEARTAYLRAYVYILDGTSASMVPEPVGLGSITVTPVAPQIDSAYYLIGTPTGWNDKDVSTLLPFSHSGKNVYEDPYFTILFESSGNCYWKVIPQKRVDAVKDGNQESVWGDGVLGTAVNDDPSPEGSLAEREGDYDPGAMLIEESGWVKITLNMLERTYSVEVIGEMALSLYAPGSYQGWNPATAATLYTQGLNMKYDGYVNLADADSEFKFVNGPAWANDENKYTEYALTNDVLVAKGEKNIVISDAGFYRMTVDLSGSPYTYSATKTVWGLIGDATAGGWDSSTVMDLNAATYEWTVTTSLAAGTFKFRANNGWDINLGGDVNNLTYGGDNISVTEAGTYLVTLHLGDPKAYKATLVKQ